MDEVDEEVDEVRVDHHCPMSMQLELKAGWMIRWMMDPSFTRSVLPIEQFGGKVYEERGRFTIRRWYKS